MSKKREKIRGKVATISHNCIAINRGSDHGIEEGMFIVVLHIVEKDIEIIDPDTDELLGHIHHRKFKGVYKVYSVEEKYALAEPSGSNKRLRPLGIFARSLLPKETNRNVYTL